MKGRALWSLAVAASLPILAMHPAATAGIQVGGGDPARESLSVDPENWFDLFAKQKDPTDLDGWSRHATSGADHPLAKVSPWVWDANRGILTYTPTGPHSAEWLRRDRVYSDFILHVEWRFVPVATEKRAYQGAIALRTPEGGEIWHRAQLGDRSGGYFYGVSPIDGQPQAFDLRRKLLGRRIRPAGRWNVYEITCKGRRMSLWANGAIVNEWDACDIDSGHLGLIGRGYAMEFRRVFLKHLDVSK